MTSWANWELSRRDHCSMRSEHRPLWPWHIARALAENAFVMSRLWLFRVLWRACLLRHEPGTFIYYRTWWANRSWPWDERRRRADLVEASAPASERAP